MAIQTILDIRDLNGYDADRHREEFIRRSYDNMTKHPSFALSAGVKTAVDFGSVTTARYVCVVPGGTVSVYKNNSPESWEIGSAFLIIGCEITALSLEASTATTCWVLIAGD